MRADGRDALERVLAAQQVVAHQQAGLADDEQGVVRNRSSERVTTPSVEFSTGTMPKSAEPATVLCSTSSKVAQGTLTMEEPKKPSAASSLKVPAGPR